MTGFTLYSIPLGRRLWLAALILFLALFYEPPSWLLYVQHPFDYPLQLLAVLGQILFVQLCADYVLSLLVGYAPPLLRRWTDRERSGVFLGIEQRPDLIAMMTPVMGVLVFAFAVQVAPRLHLPWWAPFAGWMLFFVGHLIECIEDPSFTSYQLAQIEASEDSELVFLSLQSERDITCTSLETDWQGATGYLIANGWEPVDMRQVDHKKRGRMCWDRTARFRRPQRILPVFTLWHGHVDHYRLGV